MRKVGSGFYYHVYQTSDTRVVKLPTSKLRKAWLLVWWHMVPLKRLLHELFDLKGWIAQEVMRSKALIEVFPNKKTLGNPSPLSHDGSYEQDYAPRLADSFAIITTEQFKNYVHRYCELQYELWAIGHADCVWNFSLNCGILPSTDELILIDLNELWYDKDRMQKDIETKEWESSVSVVRLRKTNPEWAEIACCEIARLCTVRELDKRWNTTQGASLPQ